MATVEALACASSAKGLLVVVVVVVVVVVGVVLLLCSAVPSEGVVSVLSVGRKIALSLASK